MKETGGLIFLSGNCPALKNNKIWTGKFLVMSKGVKEYLKSHGIKYFSSRKKEIEYFKNIDSNSFKTCMETIKSQLENLDVPYKVQFHFVRDSKHRFDFGNACELLADLFTAYGVWEDDNMDIFHPSVLYIKGKGYTYDKDNPGVYIKILSNRIKGKRNDKE